MKQKAFFLSFLKGFHLKQKDFGRGMNLMLHTQEKAFFWLNIYWTWLKVKIPLHASLGIIIAETFGGKPPTYVYKWWQDKSCA